MKSEISPSELSHHGSHCCCEAEAWVSTMAYSGPTATGWIPGSLPWGPSRWPVFWCDVLSVEFADCGVHAAVAELACNAAGLSCRRVQMYVHASPQEAAGWKSLWEEEKADTAWLDRHRYDGTVYHEAVALGYREITIVDCSENAIWLNRSDGVTRIRIMANGTDDLSEVRWNRRTLVLGEWTAVD